MNVIEVITSAFAPFLDGEKPPLHVGEVFNLWYYLAGTEQTLRSDQIAYNVAEDPELKEKLHDVINNVHLPMIKEMHEFMSKEGITLPPSSPDKPYGGDFEHIPPGAKLNDEEIANELSFSLLVGANLAATSLTQSLRADVGAMFAKYFMMKVTFSLTLKQLMEKRGWTKHPPQYKP